MELRVLRRKRLMVVCFIVLFSLLLIFGICLWANKYSGSGPNKVEVSERGEEIIRTGALTDPNREVRGLWIPSVLNITFPSQQGLSAEKNAC